MFTMTVHSENQPLPNDFEDSLVIPPQDALRVYPTDDGHVAVEQWVQSTGEQLTVLFHPRHAKAIVEAIQKTAAKLGEADDAG